MMRLTLQPTEETTEEIDRLFKDVMELTQLGCQVGVCRHKLYAVRYHKENFISEEQKKIEEIRKNYMPPDVQMTTEDAVLIYEMESFLFQVKSSLDVLATSVLDKLLDPHLGRFGVDEKVKEILRDNKRKLGEKKVNKLVSVIEKSTAWLEELNDMRVEITHYSNLEGFMCFLNMPFMGGEDCVVFYPSMPDGTRATTYMSSVWKKLLSLYEAIFSVLRSKVDDIAIV